MEICSQEYKRVVPILNVGKDHNKDKGIKVGPDGQFTIIQTHL